MTDQTVAVEPVDMSQVAYGVDGGAEGIYDGIIYWVMKDGTLINRFRGEGSRREARIEKILDPLRQDRELIGTTDITIARHPDHPPLYIWDEDQGDGRVVGRAAGGGCATCDGGGCGDCR